MEMEMDPEGGVSKGRIVGLRGIGNSRGGWVGTVSIRYLSY